MSLAEPMHPAASQASVNPMLPRLFRVRSRREEGPDTFTLELEAADGGAPLAWAPGQFTMLYVFGVGEIPVSISGDASHPETLLQTIRAVGAVSRGLQQLQPGAMLGVRGPYGSAWPLAESAGKDLILIAGGLGMAPLRSPLYHIMRRRAAWRRVLLLLGARTPEGLLYSGEWERWREAGIEMEVIVDLVPAGSPAWRGHVGVVPHLIRQARRDPSQVLAFVCGPEAMMHFSVAELIGRGIGPEQIYLSMERNMKCAIGFCGHCLFGPVFICRDGPVLRYDRIGALLRKREI